MSGLYNPIDLMFRSLAADPNIDRRLAAAIKPKVIKISIGYLNSRDGEITDWATTAVTRNDAARELRAARRRRLLIERSATGYEISGRLNPVWEYA